MQRIKNKFKALSFKGKLMVLFITNTLVTFLIFNLCFQLIVDNSIHNIDITESTLRFSTFSNNETINSDSIQLLTRVDIFDEYITQLFVTMAYFQVNSKIFLSLEQKGVNPPLTSSFDHADYGSVGVYFFTPNSTFYDEPYIDSVLSNIGQSTYSEYLQRINVIYQAKNDSTDIMVRTMPGSNDFIIPNSTIISERIDGLISEQTVLTDSYVDQFTRSTPNTLIAIRLLVPRDNYNVLIEVQLKISIITDSLAQIYSYPNIVSLLVKIINKQTGQYNVLGQTGKIDDVIDISDYLTEGSKEISNSEETFLITTISIKDNQPVGTPFINGVQNSQNSNLRAIIILPESSTKTAQNVVYKFLQEEDKTLLIFIYSWAFLMVLGTIAMSLVVGNQQAHFIQFLTTKSKQYLHHPQDMHSIYMEIKEAASKEERNRLLLENLASIMHKIQTKKKINSSEKQKRKNDYPKNLLYHEFQSRMHMQDLKNLEEIGRQLKVNENFY